MVRRIAARTALVAVATASAMASTGCYSPTAVEGVPCSASGECPSGQTCHPVTRVCVRGPIEPPVVDAPDDGTPMVDAMPDAPDAPVSTDFVDDFERADGDAIGNGWIEKSPAAFALAGGAAQKRMTASDYRDNLVHRPASEDVLDVEIVVDVQFSAIPPGYAQLFVRGQSSTIATANSYTGYLMYVNGESTNTVIVGRQQGTTFVSTLAAISTTQAFTTNQRYRFVLSATGTAPVQLDARVERAAAMGWEIIGQSQVDDPAATGITTPGTVGFSGSDEATYVYQRFARKPR